MRRPHSRADFGEPVSSPKPGDEVPRGPSRSFLRELVLHSCFSGLFIAIIVWTLRSSSGTKLRRRDPVVDSLGMDSLGNAAAETLLLLKTEVSEDELEAVVNRHRKTILGLRQRGVVMEKDPSAREAIAAFQNATKRLLQRRYGMGPIYFVSFDLAIPEKIGEGHETVVLEMAPIDWMPHAVHMFLHNFFTVRRPWKAAFHRNAGHVMQAFVRAPNTLGLAFQEYDPRFPHRKYTLGFAGRPGGPEFYISTLDNTLNHGPGSQGSKTEADSCFAKIIDGFNTVDKLHSLSPKPASGNGFLQDQSDFIHISNPQLLPDRPPPSSH